MKRASVFCPIVFLWSSVSNSAEATHSVCSTVDRREGLSGKTITVRGEWLLGPEQSMLLPHNCKTSLSVDGVNWPISLHLALSNTSDADLLKGRLALNRAGLELRSRRSQGRKGKIIITVTGRIRSKQLKVFIGVGGEPIFLGFGHLGASPAELEVLDVSNIVVLRE